MSKYDPLHQHLSNLQQDIWNASFAEIESILGFSLPKSARSYPAWWANNTQGSRHKNAWRDAGWMTGSLNLEKGAVTFRRVGTRVAPTLPRPKRQSAPIAKVKTSSARSISHSTKNSIVLLSCVKSKQDHICSARDMYTSALFRKMYAYAESLSPKRIYILSAKYGLLAPEDKIQPYEQTLNTMSVRERRQWGESVLKKLRKVTDLEKDSFVILAGMPYRENLLPHMQHYDVPMEGLSIGRQLQWLDKHTGHIAAKALPKQQCSKEKHNFTVGKVSQSAATSEACTALHEIVARWPRYRAGFDPSDIPKNGIYFLFEHGETAHGGERIVRVGTHTGQNNLAKRIQEHLFASNKDRSIFRKHIGRCLLSRDGNLFLKQWEIDLTTKAAREKYAHTIDMEQLKRTEGRVSEYMNSSFSFAVLQVDQKEDRLHLEEAFIGTLVQCPICRPSKKWLGLHHPKAAIRDSGLWNVLGLKGNPLSKADVKRIL